MLEQASDELSEVFRKVLGGRRLCLWLVFRMGRPKEIISVFYQKFVQGIRWYSLEEGGVLATMMKSMMPKAKRSTEKPE